MYRVIVLAHTKSLSIETCSGKILNNFQKTYKRVVLDNPPVAIAFYL